MPRYVTKPISMAHQYDEDDWGGDSRGTDVYDSGEWSEDQPTGILTAQGDMIYRCSNAIGFLADN